MGHWSLWVFFYFLQFKVAAITCLHHREVMCQSPGSASLRFGKSSASGAVPVTIAPKIGPSILTFLTLAIEVLMKRLKSSFNCALWIFWRIKKRCYLCKDRRERELMSGHLVDKIYRVKIQHIFFRNVLFELLGGKIEFSMYNFLISKSMSSVLLITFKNTLIIQVGLFLCFAVFRYIGICTLRIFFLWLVYPRWMAESCSTAVRKNSVCKTTRKHTLFFPVLYRGAVLNVINGVFWFNRQCCYVLTLQYCSKVDPGKKKIIYLNSLHGRQVYESQWKSIPKETFLLPGFWKRRIDKAVNWFSME